MRLGNRQSIAPIARQHNRVTLFFQALPPQFRDATLILDHAGRHDLAFMLTLHMKFCCKLGPRRPSAQ
jgi:hypothetical protein